MMDDRMRFRFWPRDLDGSLAHRDTLLPGRVVDRKLKSTAFFAAGFPASQPDLHREDRNCFKPTDP
jgi:hypothetical protein